MHTAENETVEYAEFATLARFFSLLAEEEILIA
jgi:hypothetical protein